MSYNKETGVYEGYIYLITNNIRHEEIYVGQTIRTVQIRWKEHLRQADETDDPAKLYCKMRYYGVSNFRIHTIEQHQSSKKSDLIRILNYREKFYIKLFDSYNNGLNSTYGGRDLVAINDKEVYQYDIYGNFVAKFISVQEAAQQNNVSESNIIACCKRQHNYCANSIFRYEYVNKEDLVETIECVWQIDKNNNIVAKYFSYLSASKHTGINVSNICGCCSGKRGSAGGFMWHHHIPSV